MNDQPPPVSCSTDRDAATAVLDRDARIGRFIDASRDARTADEWRDAAELLLSSQPCVFHRNLEISAAYAWMYLDKPELFKWCGMAAFASYHARLLLIPFKFKVDPTGAVIEPALRDHRSGRVRRWLGIAMNDIEIIRHVNNSIYRDIFWAHASYRGTFEGIERLRRALIEHEQRDMLRGFELIERGRLLMDTDPRRASRFIRAGNLRLLRHEQQAIVQPNFDRLSDRFGQLMSIGSSLNFEADNLWHRARYFVSFYLSMLLRRPSLLVRTRSLPRITNFDHRWSWASTSVVGQFESLERHAAGQTIQTRLARILDAAG